MGRSCPERDAGLIQRKQDCKRSPPEIFPAGFLDALIDGTTEEMITESYLVKETRRPGYLPNFSL